MHNTGQNAFISPSFMTCAHISWDGKKAKKAVILGSILPTRRTGCAKDQGHGAPSGPIYLFVVVILKKGLKKIGTT